MAQNPLRLDASQILVNENGTSTQIFQSYLNKLAQIWTVVGDGSPEGVLELPQYSTYVDESTPTAPVSYRKMIVEIGGDRKKGWIVT